MSAISSSTRQCPRQEDPMPEEDWSAFVGCQGRFVPGTHCTLRAASGISVSDYSSKFREKFNARPECCEEMCYRWQTEYRKPFKPLTCDPLTVRVSLLVCPPVSYRLLFQQGLARFPMGLRNPNLFPSPLIPSHPISCPTVTLRHPSYQVLPGSHRVLQGRSVSRGEKRSHAQPRAHQHQHQPQACSIMWRLECTGQESRRWRG